MMWGMGYGGWPIMGIGYGIIGLIWMFLSFILFLALPIILFVYLVKWIMKEKRCKNYYSGKTDDEEALSILKRRYANGEITKEQYEEMRNTIKNTV